MTVGLWPLVWRGERLNSWFLAISLVETNGLSTFGNSVKWPLYTRSLIFLRCHINNVKKCILVSNTKFWIFLCLFHVICWWASNHDNLEFPFYMNKKLNITKTFQWNIVDEDVIYILAVDTCYATHSLYSFIKTIHEVWNVEK